VPGHQGGQQPLLSLYGGLASHIPRAFSRSDPNEEVWEVTGKRPVRRSDAPRSTDLKPIGPDEDYIDYVRNSPCCVCGQPSTEAGKSNAAHFPVTRGAGAPKDWVIPLCGECHHEQHQDPVKFMVTYQAKWAAWFYYLIATTGHYDPLQTRTPSTRHGASVTKKGPSRGNSVTLPDTTEHYTDGLFDEFKERQKGYRNTAEQAFTEEARALGWKVTKRGWPDFLCISPNGRVEAVEVKPKDTCNLSKVQNVAARALEKLGLKVRLWTPDDNWLPDVGLPPATEHYYEPVREGTIGLSALSSEHSEHEGVSKRSERSVSEASVASDTNSRVLKPQESGEAPERLGEDGGVDSPRNASAGFAGSAAVSSPVVGQEPGRVPGGRLDLGPPKRIWPPKKGKKRVGPGEGLMPAGADKPGGTMVQWDTVVTEPKTYDSTFAKCQGCDTAWPTAALNPGLLPGLLPRRPKKPVKRASERRTAGPLPPHTHGPGPVR
jgi:hypothetical protein